MSRFCWLALFLHSVSIFCKLLFKALCCSFWFSPDNVLIKRLLKLQYSLGWCFFSAAAVLPLLFGPRLFLIASEMWLPLIFTLSLRCSGAARTQLPL